MKRLNILLISSILSLSLLGGCNTPSLIDEVELNSSLISDTDNINQYAIDNNQIIINLTPIGLYKHSKGSKLESYYLENVVTISSWKIGDALPLSDITSTVEHVRISSFVYYQKGGELSSSNTIISGQNFYQCYFIYDETYTNPDAGKLDSSSYSGDNSSSSDPSISDPSSSIGDTSSSSTSLDDKTRTIYFMDNTWWNKDAATSSIYYWGTNINCTWPGIVMNHVEYIKTGDKSSDGSYDLGKNVWSISLDFSSISGFLFARTGYDGVAGSTSSDWGAKTIDISLSNLGSNNLVILDQNEALWGSGCNVKYATYIEGKLNY